MDRSALIGQYVGQRLIIAPYCNDEDWLRLGMTIPARKDKYVLAKCPTCGRLIPTQLRYINAPLPTLTRCAFCSGIGCRGNVVSRTNEWCMYSYYSILKIWSGNKELHYTVVNNEDYPLLSQYTWRIVKKRNKEYVITGQFRNGTAMYMHAMIIGQPIPPGYSIDHIDGNSLNNKRENLRVIPASDNSRFIQVKCTSQTGIRGVSPNTLYDLYKVDFSYNHMRFYFGDFKTLEEAAYCRLCAEEYFGLETFRNNKVAMRAISNIDPAKAAQIRSYVLNKIELKLHESAGM